MDFLDLYLFIGLVVLCLMMLVWLISLVLRNSSVVDIFWGTGFVLVVWASFLMGGQGYLPRKILLAALVTIWGMRLSLHILRRNAGKPEDFRYAMWRAEHGSRWWWVSLFQVFLLQGAGGGRGQSDPGPAGYGRGSGGRALDDRFLLRGGR